MLTLFTLVLVSQTACTSLEERVEIFDAGGAWTSTTSRAPTKGASPCSAECFIDGTPSRRSAAGILRVRGRDPIARSRPPEKLAHEVEEDECYAQGLSLPRARPAGA